MCTNVGIQHRQDIIGVIVKNLRVSLLVLCLGENEVCVRNEGRRDEVSLRMTAVGFKYRPFDTDTHYIRGWVNHERMLK